MTQSIFLSDAELHELTGYVRNADRCRWLKQHAWRFEKSARTGRPIVLRSYAESKLSDPAASMARAEPRLKLASIRG